MTKRCPKKKQKPAIMAERDSRCQKDQAAVRSRASVLRQPLTIDLTGASFPTNAEHYLGVKEQKKKPELVDSAHQEESVWVQPVSWIRSTSIRQ